MLEKVSQIHKTYLMDQQLFCWKHFSKAEVVQNTDLNILALQENTNLVKEIHKCDGYEYDDFVADVDEQSLLYV